MLFVPWYIHEMSMEYPWNIHLWDFMNVPRNFDNFHGTLVELRNFHEKFPWAVPCDMIRGTFMRYP